MVPSKFKFPILALPCVVILGLGALIDKVWGRAFSLDAIGGDHNSIDDALLDNRSIRETNHGQRVRGDLALDDGAAKKKLGGRNHIVVDPWAEDFAAEWIAVAPRAVAEDLEPLASHRERQGVKSAAIVCVEDLTVSGDAETKAKSATRDAIVKFARGARSRGGARFVLLVGDAIDIPAGVVRSGGLTRYSCHSDVVYAEDDGDALPDGAIGRFPNSNPELVRAFVKRVLDYEGLTEPAGWRRRISFLAGSGGFGAAVDKAIDAAVSGLLDRELPAEYDLRVLRPDPGSAFGVKPEAENSAIFDLWNSGSLVLLYAGHGSRHGMHTATGLGLTRTIFTSAKARELDIRNGAPLVMLFACNTAEFSPVKGKTVKSAVDRGVGDRGADFEPACLAEALLVNPKGAIAVLGASETSHPYPDLLMAHEFNELFRANPKMPIGEMVLQAKRRMSTETGEFRKNVDQIAGLFGLAESERTLLIEYEQGLYQLFGDPALVLRCPDVKIDIRGPSSAKPGEEIEFAIHCEGFSGARVVARLESTRGAVPSQRGFPAANLRTLDQTAGVLEGTAFTGHLTIPRDRQLRRAILSVDVLRESADGASSPIAKGPGGPGIQGSAALVVKIESP